MLSTIQRRATRTITSSYFLWVDLLSVDIITFPCVSYLISACCECALLPVEILAILSLSLCACECACLAVLCCAVLCCFGVKGVSDHQSLFCSHFCLFLPTAIR